MTPVQMNVRIERDLKLAGDAAFEEIGYTPTEVVREMWGFAKRNRRNRRVLADMMRSLRDPRDIEVEDAATAQHDAEFEEWLERGPSIVREYCVQAGVDFDPIPSLTPEEYDELLAESLEEDHERVGRGQ